MLDLPRELLAQILELVPLDSALAVRRACRDMRTVVDAVWGEKGFKASAREEEEEESESESCSDDDDFVPPILDKEYIFGPLDVGRALYVCWVVRASWIHHVACVGSPDMIKYAIQMGEVVGGRLSTSGFEKYDLEYMQKMTPLMVASALGRTEVVGVLLEVRGGEKIPIEDDAFRRDCLPTPRKRSGWWFGRGMCPDRGSSNST